MSTKACYNCGHKNHIAKNCTNQSTNFKAYNSFDKCFNCGEYGHISYDCTNHDSTSNYNCYECNQPGHIARECHNFNKSNNSNKQCYNCGEYGHLSINCNADNDYYDEEEEEQEEEENNEDVCFECGKHGHWAKECPNKYNNEEFYCETHYRYFKDQEAYDQHMNSNTHIDDYLYCEENEHEDEEGEEECDGENDDYDDLPKPVLSEGNWVERHLFEGEKSFGYFKCPCKKWWISAHSFPIYRQGCKKCETYSLPKYLWENKSYTIKKDVDEEESPHDVLRCEACKLGKCK